jgi:hypothetical protein
VNAEVAAAARAHDDRARELKLEILRLEREAGNLVRFPAGGESFSVRIELQSIETGLQGLRLELAEIEHEAGLNEHASNISPPCCETTRPARGWRSSNISTAA